MANIHQIKINHPAMGELLNDTYQNTVQFNIFLNLIHSCLELKQDLTTYNGKDFLIHVPHTVLRECVVISRIEDVSLAEYAISKSKLEKM